MIVAIYGRTIIKMIMLNSLEWFYEFFFDHITYYYYYCSYSHSYFYYCCYKYYYYWSYTSCKTRKRKIR